MSIQTVTRNVKIGSREATLIVAAEGSDAHTILSRIVACVAAMEGVNTPSGYILTLRRTRIVLKERTKIMSKVLKDLLHSNKNFPGVNIYDDDVWWTKAHIFRAAKKALDGFRELKPLRVDTITPTQIFNTPKLERSPVLTKDEKFNVATDALSKCNGSRRKAAEYLGIGERTIYRWLSNV